MKAIQYTIRLMILLVPFISQAQVNLRKAPTKKFNFTEVWVWEYTDVNGNSGEMAIYREPKLNYWLLTPDDAGFRNSDGMSLWFMVKPNGDVIQAYQDGEINSPKKTITHKLDVAKINRIPVNWKRTGKTRKFGDPSTGFPYINGKEYQVVFDKTNDRSHIILGGTQANFSSLSLFNNLNIDAKLPIQFPQNIPGNLIPLSEFTTFSTGKIQYTLKYITPSEYHIDLNDFN